MSDDINWDDEDQFEDDAQQAPANDNKAIKALRDKAKADGATITELKTQLEKLSNDARERTVKEVLEKKGVNPKATRLVLKDVTEATEENIDAWLKDNAELFNLKVTEDVTDENTESFDELSSQDAFTSQAVSPGTGRDMQAKINSFKTFDELAAYVASQQ